MSAVAERPTTVGKEEIVGSYNRVDSYMERGKGEIIGFSIVSGLILALILIGLSIALRSIGGVAAASILTGVVAATISLSAFGKHWLRKYKRSQWKEERKNVLPS